MERIPRSGEFYRHFKNNLYQVITVAEHSETGEQLVIYQALYGDFKIYARPLEMFAGEVDRAKYPDVCQKYRFEKVELQDVGAAVKGTAPAAAEFRGTETQTKEMPQEAASHTGQLYAQARIKETVSDAEENGVDARLMEFFDTDDYDTRYNILVSMRDSITDMQINNLAVALDIVIPEGDLEDRYEQLKRCLRMRQKYENNRLR